jgi:hypothetical protein
MGEVLIGSTVWGWVSDPADEVEDHDGEEGGGRDDKEEVERDWKKKEKKKNESRWWGMDGEGRVVGGNERGVRMIMGGWGRRESKGESERERESVQSIGSRMRRSRYL